MNPRPALVKHDSARLTVGSTRQPRLAIQPGRLVTPLSSGVDRRLGSRLGGFERSGATPIERALRYAIEHGIFYTMFYGTKTTIDSAGRLVIPKSLRVAAGLVPGMPLTITFREGRIEIEPAPLEVELVDRGGFTVAEPVTPVEPLSHETVRDTRDQIRTGRKRR